MSIIVIYGFSGRYSGNSEHEYNYPELGAVHRSMLFFRQQADTDDYAAAQTECQRYGFTDIAFSGCGALQIDVLNTDAYRGFAGLYEEALSTGSALVYYPNKA